MAFGPRRAVFLDRDGTINEERDYIRSPDQLLLLPGSGPAIWAFNRNGFVVAVISNQAGPAHGYFDEGVIESVNQELVKQLAANSARLDAIYYCPHHPEGVVDKYRVCCSCRKPEIGLILEAGRAFHVDLARSFMVGDKQTDVGAGRRAGCFTILVETGFGRREIERGFPEGCEPDLVVPDLRAASSFIIGGLSG